MDRTASRAEQFAHRIEDLGLSVAVAESLTGGLLANRLARIEGAGAWFRGGVVAYAAEVKHDLLAVPPGPVVSEPAVTAMATSTCKLLGAEVAVAVSGVGGPDPQDGIPAGTVWIAATVDGETTAELHHFDGDPEAVCEQTCDAGLRLAIDLLGERPPPPSGVPSSAGTP